MGQARRAAHVSRVRNDPGRAWARRFRVSWYCVFVALRLVRGMFVISVEPIAEGANSRLCTSCGEYGDLVFHVIPNDKRDGLRPATYNLCDQCAASLSDQILFPEER